MLVSAVSPEDELRANFYRLLARWLAEAPSSADFEFASSLKGDDTPLGRVIRTFSHMSGRVDHEDVSREYHDLFIGVARGELVPYASYYLTGFLNEKPLAKLRGDMIKLGIERDPAVKEPEDHIAALMDMMAGLITGEYGEPASLAEQKRFFDTHIGPWAEHFFADLEGAKKSVLYASLAAVGRLFVEIEEAAFAMS